MSNTQCSYCNLPATGIDTDPQGRDPVPACQDHERFTDRLYSAPCPECIKPCPEHAVTFCATCHKHEGECDYGSCQHAATRLLRFPGEARRFCDHHATDAKYGFARAGAEIAAKGGN